MVLNKDLIRSSEESTVKSGAFTFRELMLEAGKAAADIIIKKYTVQNKKIAVLCGKGNNGGDGCVIASLLAEQGAEVTVVLPYGAPVTENAAYYFRRLQFVGVSDSLPKDCDIIIDALFGIGFKGKLDAEAEALINRVNAKRCIRIAVDIPSGVEADSGRVQSVAVKADMTVTFIALKPCFVLPEGSDYCGEVEVADIGVRPIDKSFDIIKEPIFEPRRHNSHKGSYGTALNICGSYGMAGAAMLSAKAALRSGVGILKAAVCEGIYPAFTSYLPEAVCLPLKQNGMGTLSYAYTDLEMLTKGASAILIGCGLGNNNDTSRLTEELIKISNVPTVIDADGINCISDRIDIIKNTKAPIILTPHPGEMARLLKVSVREIEQARVDAARKFAAEYGCILVLKGADTIVATPDGEISFNLTGNPGMATGGSGDVLAGITVSLLAQGMEPEKAAKAAVYLHGAAGDRAAAKRGESALLPSDIIEEL